MNKKRKIKPKVNNTKSKLIKLTQKVRKEKTKVENLTLSEKYQHNQETNKTEIKAL